MGEIVGILYKKIERCGAEKAPADSMIEMRITVEMPIYGYFNNKML